MFDEERDLLRGIRGKTVPQGGPHPTAHDPSVVGAAAINILRRDDNLTIFAHGDHRGLADRRGNGAHARVETNIIDDDIEIDSAGLLELEPYGVWLAVRPVVYRQVYLRVAFEE